MPVRLFLPYYGNYDDDDDVVDEEHVCGQEEEELGCLALPWEAGGCAIPGVAEDLPGIRATPPWGPSCSWGQMP